MAVNKFRKTNIIQREVCYKRSNLLIVNEEKWDAKLCTGLCQLAVTVMCYYY